MADAPSPAAAAGADRWLDVQPFLDRVQGQMPLGQLLHGEGFSLFASMSAIEIGDAKMDQTLLDRDTVTIGQLLEQKAPASLSAPDLVGVLDRLLAMEASWHNGATVVQSLFTCLYLHQPTRAAEHMPVLAAYCTATLASSGLVQDINMQGAAAEDEDFMPFTFGLPLKVPSSEEVDKASQQLDLALAQLASLQGGGTGADGGLAAAMQCRLRFRKALMQALVHLRGLPSGKPDLEAAQQLLGSASAELQQVRETVQEGEQEAGADIGFDMQINSVLAIPIPPRPFKLYTVAEALDYYRKLLADLSRATALRAVASWPHLQALCTAFSMRRAAPLARSALHLCINRAHRVAGVEPFPWSPSRDMVCSTLGLPPYAELTAPELLDFVNQCAIGMENWCQVMCLNPARQHRRYKRLLEDWANIYTHAINSDLAPQVQELMRAVGWRWQPLDAEGGEDLQGPLGSFVEREAAMAAAQRLLCGFELQLYAAHELPMAYWYIDYLLRVVQINAQQLHSCSPGSAPPPQQRRGGRQRSAQQHKAAQQAVQKREAAANQHMQEAVALEAHRMAAQGIMRSCLAMQVAGKGRPVASPFNGAAQRFEQRFGLLQMLARPEALACGAYIQSMDTDGMSASQLYQGAWECLHKAHNALAILNQGRATSEMQEEQVAYYKAMDRACMANMVAVRLLQNGSASAEAAAAAAAIGKKKAKGKQKGLGEAEDRLTVSWDAGPSTHYPVMKVKTAAA